jgi:uncharacterized protein YecT (DUF1311 family)
MYENITKSIQPIATLRLIFSLDKFGGIMKFINIACAALLLIATTATAREDCSHKPNELELQQCIVDNYKEADNNLNAVYSELIKLLADPTLLRKAQRAWVAYRDAECTFVTSNDDSVLGSGWFRGCAEKKTLARIEELKKHLYNAKSECSQCPPIKH